MSRRVVGRLRCQLGDELELPDSTVVLGTHATYTPAGVELDVFVAIGADIDGRLELPHVIDDDIDVVAPDPTTHNHKGDTP